MLRRIQGEFREMPGLRVTVAQAQRLWALDAGTCEAILDRLVREQYLQRTADGRRYSACGHV
jgi:DNA-binding IclR family transcriptional regulator